MATTKGCKHRMSKAERQQAREAAQAKAQAALDEMVAPSKTPRSPALTSRDDRVIARPDKGAVSTAFASVYVKEDCEQERVRWA